MKTFALISKGEKDRNIEDAHDFNLRLPTLEYHSKTWTWQDLSMAMKKDYTQVLVPQVGKIASLRKAELNEHFGQTLCLF